MFVISCNICKYFIVLLFSSGGNNGVIIIIIMYNPNNRICPLDGWMICDLTFFSIVFHFMTKADNESRYMMEQR